MKFVASEPLRVLTKKLNRSSLRYLATFAYCWVTVFGFPALLFAQYDPFGNSKELPKFKDACTKSLAYQNSGFASLLAAAAGVGALIAAATGGFRMAWALLVIALGSYILFDHVERWFKAACPNG